MEIKVIKFADIVPDDYNPRRELKPGDVEFDRIKSSITNFGYMEPIVYNAHTGHIVGGHQRVSVMQALGMTEAEMSVVDVDEHEEKLLNLRLNKIKGRWDYDKLEDLLRGFTMDEALLTGFGSDELAVMLAKADDFDMEGYDDGSGDYEDDEEDDGDEDENDVPEDFDGASWVVTLKFKSADTARKWCEEHGHPGAVKDGAGTTVIRIE